jgi:glycosyltransferase involved in cell wall biosynthesis
MTTLRVLTLIDGFRMGGAETLLVPLAVAARDPDLKIDMDILGVGPEANNADKTLTLLADAGVRPRSLGIRRLLDPSGIPRLTREIRDGGYDVVHAHLEMAMSLAVPAARLARRPIVCTFHHVTSPLTGRGGWRERVAVEAASRSDRVLFVSEASRKSFGDIYRPRGLPGNWAVLHNGIDIDQFHPGQPDAAVLNELSGGRRPIVVLPAAFRHFKGIPVAIDAWPHVVREHPAALLVLVGGGPDEDALRRRVADVGMTDSIVFAGVRTDMPSIYRTADIVLLPSTYGENLPTVLIEASAAGKAVAASRIGGIPDIIVDGVTGRLFEPNDPVALAATVCELLSDESLRVNLGAAATLRARSEFSAASWARRLCALYREIAK